MSIILRVDGLLGKMTGTVYGEQVTEVRIHDLRHTYASLLVSSGRSLYEVQKILAHSDPKITMRYAHLSEKSLHEAANAASVFVPQVAPAA